MKPSYQRMHVGRVVEVVDHRPREDVRERMAAERERGDDSEVAAAAADRPEEIRLALGVGLDDRAVGEHDRRRDEVVDREPERRG